MKNSRDVGELARRAKVPEAAARSVLDALAGLIREEGGGHPPAHHGGLYSHALSPTDPRLVDELIARAELHPLGVEFLSEGSLDSVAAGFGTHAFTVEAARERLRSEAPPLPGEGNAE